MTANNGHIPPPRRIEYRCRDAYCNRKLFEGYLVAPSFVEIRCPRCGRMNVFDVPVVEIPVVKEPSNPVSIPITVDNPA